ncbi:MAG: WYL domain-containing protein, partial [Schaalia hyovaginalis]|nr:WYL domain-containing protein [Schaalia hyovaginalis]
EGDGLRDGKWREARGEPGERGEWVSRILSEVEDVVVLEPEDLREEILERLRVAESWGGANA